ncbi:restriction endonuclease subunit S [Pseudoxanthomonas japonensis]|uniref:restriction endonuclease subunit S n=1 Tax=Pseudoxanthomonas japonensis TaxID=69284 RepID=UPI003748533B
MTWPLVALEKVADVVGGSTPSRGEPRYWGPGHFWVTPTDLPMPGNGILDLERTEETITDEGLGSISANVLPVGAVLYSTRATIGKLAIANVPVVTNQGFNNLIAGPEIYNRYLAYALQFFTPDISRLAGSTTFKEVSRSSLRGFKIPVPPVKEQRRIVDLLVQADALRRLRREADAKAARILPALFLKMFGDPATNPMEWDAKPLGDLLEDAEVFTDGDWVESKDQDPDGDVRLVQLADVGDGRYVNKSARFLTRETALRLRCTFLKSGDILLARMPDPLGRACIFPGDAKECVTVVDVCVIRPHAGGPDPIWLMHCINSAGFRGLIAQQQTGTTRARISRGNLSRLPIISPPIALQREFSRLAQQAGQALEISSRAENVELVFSALLQKAFNGELTARWRQAHMQELLREMQGQAKALSLPMPKEIVA